MSDATDTSQRNKAFVWIVVSYVIAIGVGAGVVWALRSRPPWQSIGAADIVATIVIFGFSRAFDNSSFYDVYWSIIPMTIALGLYFFGGGSEVPSARRILMLLLLLIWGARLTWNWAISWTGLKHEDWRYVDLRKQTGGLYWLASFFGLHMFPTVITYLGGLAMIPAIGYGTHRLSIIDLVAVLVTGGGALLEGTADAQLRKFRRANEGRGRICEDGLWSVSRHPNYLGEMLVWWGFFLFGFAADASSWWMIVGPLSVTGLIAGISVRMIDKRSLERRPGYADHMKRIPTFLPKLFR